MLASKSNVPASFPLGRLKNNYVRNQNITTALNIFFKTSILLRWVRVPDNFFLRVVKQCFPPPADTPLSVLSTTVCTERVSKLCAKLSFRCAEDIYGKAFHCFRSAVWIIQKARWIDHRLCCSFGVSYLTVAITLGCTHTYEVMREAF